MHLPNDDVITLTVDVSRLLFEFDRDAYVAALIACREVETASVEDDAEVVVQAGTDRGEQA